MPNSKLVRRTTSSNDRASSEVTQTSEDSCRLRLEGWFAPSWVVGFCSELARLQLSVESAHVLRRVDQTWVAELHIKGLADSVDPFGVPYLELAEAVSAKDVQPLRLIRFAVEETFVAGGALHLTIEADDTLGLLGSMLAQLAMLLLFPVEMHIETRAGRAYDSFWLSAVGGAHPGAAARASLERALKRACM